MTEEKNILEIHDLKVSYGGIEAVKGVTLTVPDGKIVTLIGANGAGKSTILKTVSGIVRPKTGRILYNGEDITGKSPDKIVKAGIVLVPEGRHVFPNLTVKENLKIGAYLRRDDLSADFATVYGLFPRLKEREWQLAGTLSGGEQQMQIGRLVLREIKARVKFLDDVGLDYLSLARATASLSGGETQRIRLATQIG